MIEKFIAGLILAGTIFLLGDGIVKHNHSQTGFGACLLVLYVVVLFMTKRSVRIQREGRNRRAGKEAKDKK